MMTAAIYLKDAQGQTTRHELPATAEEELTLGSVEGCRLPLTAESPEHPLHVRITRTADGQYALQDMTEHGCLMVNDSPVPYVLLIEGVTYCLGSYKLTYTEEKEAAQKAAPTPAPAASKGRKSPSAASKKAAPMLRRSGGSAAPLDIPLPAKENALLTLITPVYVTVVLIAAFIAGMTLRYWFSTGLYLPSVW